MHHVEAWHVIRTTAARQHGVVSAEQCQSAGVSPDEVKRLCRAKAWLRLNRAAYLVDAADHDGDPPRLSVISAAVLSAGRRAVAVLGTAAELHGMAGLRREPIIHLSLPGDDAKPRRPTEPGVRLHQLTLRPGDTMSVAGLVATTPVRTVADLVLRVDRYAAVSLVDSALNRRLLGAEDLYSVRGLMTGRRGARRARPWLTEADARAESPLETRVRLRAFDGGLPPDELQYRVRNAGGVVVAIADLAWTRARLVGEADGFDAHDNPVALFRDRKRQNAIVNAGFTAIRFTWEDTLSPGYIPEVVRVAIARASAA
jgi:very-short-patch-repair endonuclease